MWTGSSDFLLINRMAKLIEYNFHDEVKKDSGFPLPFSPAHSDKARGHVVSCSMKRSMCQGTNRDLWPTF